MIETILLGIILLEFAYIIYKDYLNYREKERLQLKLISRNATEYQDVSKEIDKKPKKSDNKDKKQDEYIDIHELPTEKLMKAEDNL